MEPLQPAFGQRLRTARRRLGLTQAETARHAGLALEVYGRIERGQALPSPRALRRLCNVLAISADELLVTHLQRPSVTGAPLPEVDASPELLQLVGMLRTWPRPKLRMLDRMLRVITRACEQREAGGGS
jgi:transcriptional regulator with XRE-family HTH domain